MLPAEYRLRRSSEFLTTTRRGLRAGRGHIVVHFQPPAATSNATAVSSAALFTDAGLVGFTVSKAVGGSVVRHRVVRQLRAAVFPLLDELPRGSRLVVRALPAAAGASTQVLSEEVASAVGAVLTKWKKH